MDAARLVAQSQRSQMTANAPYFVGAAALAAGAAAFIASQVMMFLEEGSFGLWLFAIMASLMAAIAAGYGTGLIGLVVFAVSCLAPIPRTSIGQALFVGALYAGIGVSIALVTLAVSEGPLFFVTVLSAALTGSLAAGFGAWLVHRSSTFPR